LILIFNIQICQILALVQKKKKKKNPRAKHEKKI